MLIIVCQASYGVNLIRFFGNIDGNGKASGYGYLDTTVKSILVSLDPVTLAGTYNETNFRRFDLVLAEACKDLAAHVENQPQHNLAPEWHLHLHLHLPHCHDPFVHNAT